MIVERIVSYLKHKGIAVSSFERNLGLGNATLSKAYRTGGSIGTDKLEKIISICEDLSPVWLLTGRGEMIVDATPHSASEKSEGAAIEVSVVRTAGAVIISDAAHLESLIHDAVSKAMQGQVTE